jgi:hypothetical protein
LTSITTPSNTNIVGSCAITIVSTTTTASVKNTLTTYGRTSACATTATAITTIGI